MANRNALKDILMGLATDAEKASYAKLDAGKIKEVIAAADEEHAAKDAQIVAMHETMMKTLSLVEKQMKISALGMTRLLESIGSFTERMNKSLDGLGGSMKEGFKGAKGPELSGFFKDFGVQLAQYAESSNNTASLISNLKWNASQQLRDTNGSPINPAIAPFAVTAAYDEIALSNYSGANVGTVTYKQAGNVVAILQLTYSGNNLTDVIRTQ